jgi:hypothetical protein
MMAECMTSDTTNLEGLKIEDLQSSLWHLFVLVHIILADPSRHPCAAKLQRYE